MRLLFFFYRLFAHAKHTVLVAGFGYSSRCRHQPTCSQYTLQAMQKHGTITGLWKGWTRLLSCW